MSKYIVEGRQAGSCRHAHTTLSEAEECRRRYAQSHPLSDRTIKRLEGSRRCLLSAEEYLTVVRSEAPRKR